MAALPSGTFEGTIEQSEAPIRVEYVVTNDIEIPIEVEEVHLELNWPQPIWSREGRCVIKYLEIEEEVVFSGYDNRVTMISLDNAALGVLQFIWNPQARTLVGGDEFWDPLSPPTITARQVSNAHLGSGEQDEICKAGPSPKSENGDDLDNPLKAESSQDDSSKWTTNLQLKADQENRTGNPAMETGFGQEQFPDNAVLAARGELSTLKVRWCKEDHEETLRSACFNGQVETVQWLLSKGCCSENMYFEALSCRSQHDGAAIVKMIGTKGVDAPESVLPQCALSNNVIALKYLLPSFRCSLAPATVVAAKNGKAAALQVLLGAKASPNNGHPLHAACKAGRSSTIRILAPLAACDERDEDGYAPLDYLKIYDHEHLIQVLQDARKPSWRRIR
eukprot:GEMP01019105.1.p1 GENE.GEMP01019105.1~~GEMP01019105.1.p1  ORF type:complete len:392 (+),score=67.40 GEMP01019105.1:75-1250(+)